jgi:hypothetical protein
MQNEACGRSQRRSRPGRLEKIGLLALAAALVAGCTAEADMSAVGAEGIKPVRRYDITQSLASNAKVLVGGTSNGAVLVSNDQGKTWERHVLGGASIVSLAACPDGSFVGVDFYRRVWSGSDDGATWTSHPIEKPRTPLAVTCDGQGRWWVAGTNTTIAGSKDHGATWQYADLGQDAQLTAIQFFDAEHGIALGEFGKVIATEDGGATWSKAGQIPNDFYPYAALFADRQHGWASGIAGQIVYTADGGKTWTKQANAAQAPLYRLFMHGGIPYGVGAGGAGARYEGGSWRAVPYPDPTPVFLGAGASLDGQGAIAIAGPGGLVRVVGTKVN